MAVRKGSIRLVVLSALIIVALIGINTQRAYAEVGMNICAAVFPCDDQGFVLEEFSSPDSPCLDTYLAQCAAYRLDLVENDAFQTKIAELEDENSKLKKRIQALKRKLRQRRR